MTATKPSLSIFSGSKDLGSIFSEQNQINVKFWDINLPLTSTTGRLSINAMGKTRIIMVQGAHSGVNFDGVSANAKLGDFIYEMEQWINANIQSTAIYTDSFGVSYNVDAVDWTWTRSFQDPFRIIYSLILKES